MRIGSMFSGIGGLELGLEMLGVGEVAWQAERDPYALSILAKHWPKVRRITDVRHITADDNADIICGGFPCQDISTAGKGVGITGERSGLWKEIVRVAEVLRPRMVFIENVSALRKRGLDVVLADLAQMGFNAEWGCFRASEVGAPHRRERMFILAYTDGNGLEKDTHEALICGAALKRIVSGRLGKVDCAAVWAKPRPIGAYPMGVGNGIPGALDRIRCLGNAVVPLQSAYAFSELYQRAFKQSRTGS